MGERAPRGAQLGGVGSMRGVSGRGGAESGAETMSAEMLSESAAGAGPRERRGKSSFAGSEK